MEAREVACLKMRAFSQKNEVGHHDFPSEIEMSLSFRCLTIIREASQCDFFFLRILTL